MSDIASRVKAIIVDKLAENIATVGQAISYIEAAK